MSKTSNDCGFCGSPTMQNFAPHPDCPKHGKAVNETKHTLGLVGVCGTRVFLEKTGETVAATIQGEQDHATKQANAERLALTWNCHDALLAACRSYRDAYVHHQSHPDYWNGLEKTDDIAKAAIALATNT